jgi:hypothetical protein
VDYKCTDAGSQESTLGISGNTVGASCLNKRNINVLFVRLLSSSQAIDSKDRQDNQPSSFAGHCNFPLLPPILDPMCHHVRCYEASTACWYPFQHGRSVGGYTTPCLEVLHLRRCSGRSYGRSMRCVGGTCLQCLAQQQRVSALPYRKTLP